MKKLVAVLLLLYCFNGVAQNIPSKPNPPRLVNDFANVLTPDQREALERKLVSYDDSTSTQIAIVTVQTTGDYDIQDYALKILRDWGVGGAKNNGIVILAAIEDRKIRIETGYGMEGVIPDITANEIIENEIKPHFRESNVEDNYYRGFDEAVDAIIKAAAGEYKAPENYNRRNTGRKSGSGLSVLIPLIILIIIISRMGGGGGRGGGGMMSRRGFNPFWGGFLGGMLGSGMSRGSGWGGDSGGWGGGGWGGGGGGGGFGGFGGGGGGGGGASGSW